MFSKKLVFIMNITNTSASALGKACHLNPSHISRLRSGSRALPKKPDFLQSMSEYMAKRVTEDYQKEAVCKALKISSYPAGTEQAAEMIRQWLAGSEMQTDLSALIKSFSDIQSAGDLNEETYSLPAAKKYYYGEEGKREAVLHFFDLILKEKEPQTLLLSSDEDMNWLSDDPVFAARWANDFKKVLTAGSRVRIIHSIGRRLEEMTEAISKWIPMYLTGMIEPFYYPKPRDSVFQRTLFIAPKTAAIVSSSVNGRTDGMLNELITDKTAIAALSQEFDRYFSLCHPLMHITMPESHKELWSAYRALLDCSGDIICMSDKPTLMTMPEHVALSMQERAPQSCIYERWKEIAGLARNISGNTSVTEILPPLYSGAENVPLPCAEFLGAPGLCYTSGEWQAHLENAARFAVLHKWYSCRTNNNVPDSIHLFVKDSRGVIMIRSSVPSAAFAFSELNLINFFYDYMSRL